MSKWYQQILGTMPSTIHSYYMSDLIQSLPSPSAYSGNYSHMDGGIMDGWWRGVGDDDGDDLLRFPVPAGCQNGASGLRNRVSRGGGVADFFLEKLRTPRKFHVTSFISLQKKLPSGTNLVLGRGRWWPSGTYFGASVADPKTFFFRFRGPLQPRIGPKRGRWSSGPWSMMISRFRLRSQRNSVLWRAWGPNVSDTGDLFFSRSRTCLSFPGRAVYDSRSWVPDVSLTKRENIEFLDSFSPLISGYSALTSIPAPLLNVEGGCRLMGPRCQPHKTRIVWFLPLFFTTDIWLLDFKYQSLPPC